MFSKIFLKRTKGTKRARRACKTYFKYNLYDLNLLYVQNMGKVETVGKVEKVQILRVKEKNMYTNIYILIYCITSIIIYADKTNVCWLNQ